VLTLDAFEKMTKVFHQVREMSDVGAPPARTPVATLIISVNRYAAIRHPGRKFRVTPAVLEEPMDEDEDPLWKRWKPCPVIEALAGLCLEAGFKKTNASLCHNARLPRPRGTCHTKATEIMRCVQLVIAATQCRTTIKEI